MIARARWLAVVVGAVLAASGSVRAEPSDDAIDNPTSSAQPPDPYDTDDGAAASDASPVERDACTLPRSLCTTLHAGAESAAAERAASDDVVAAAWARVDHVYARALALLARADEDRATGKK